MNELSIILRSFIVFLSFFCEPGVEISLCINNKEKKLIQTDRYVFLSADDDDRWRKPGITMSVLTGNFHDFCCCLMHVSVDRVQPVIKKAYRNQIKSWGYSDLVIPFWSFFFISCHRNVNSSQSASNVA